ncbi:hypothetical protein [Vulcanisaeta distributa]|uniref:hypothetical protein n=1 Tax=Vulcanisaeta distributa TaxID=164451 RepID=UPI001FB1EA30|nr:hypothetical protein [Vulcanisaeta distributa]
MPIKKPVPNWGGLVLSYIALLITTAIASSMAPGFSIILTTLTVIMLAVWLISLMTGRHITLATVLLIMTVVIALAV